MNELAGADGLPGPARSFSLRHEFSTKWHQFLNPPPDSAGDQTLTLPLTKERLPFLFRDKSITFAAVEVLVKVKPDYTGTPHDETTLKLSIEPGTAAFINALALAGWNGLLRGTKMLAGDPGDWTLTAWLDEGDDEHKRLDPAALEDIVVVCRYTCS